MLTQAQVDQFDRDGFLRGGKVILDQRQLETLRGEMARVIADRDDATKPQPVGISTWGAAEGRPVWQIINIYDASPSFRELATHATIAEEVAQLARATELRIWHDQIQWKPASTGGVNMWHQDSPYWPVLTPADLVTAWVALDDVDADNGCMSMVPGSHRWGDTIDFLHTLKSFDAMPGEYQGNPVEVRRCPVRAGEVHYHHSLTWHGSHGNTSGRERRALAIHFLQEHTRYVAEHGHPMKPFIASRDGEPVRGDRFPLVWRAGAACLA
ncbi:MAG TPA: phytanoyl-CoA dioxygenase family protein [Planctomycetota bacterium]|nr:phytanoyl-CoA dioxygenase family protein [Planctomycetota bacterium]